MNTYRIIEVDADLINGVIDTDADFIDNIIDVDTDFIDNIVDVDANLVNSIEINNTSDYELLNKKPLINSVTLIGDKSFEQLGLHSITNTELENMLR